MRFVHAADLHLDSPLSGLVPYEGAPVEEVRAATRRALAGLVDLCLEERAELLLLAGDLYDGDWKDYSTGLFFLQQMNRLAEAGTEVVWIRGNHDAASRITRFLEPPAHVRELGSKRPETVTFSSLGVAVHGISYATRDVTENLASHYPEPMPGLLNIGLLHTALDGRPGHASYAPCRLSDLVDRGYDYWALGHIHQREVVCEHPWVVFPGNLQGRHVQETGPKGATLIEVDGGRITSVTHRPLDVVRWERVCLPLQSESHLDEVAERILGALAEARKEAGERTLAVRLELSGRTSLHRELLEEHERLLAQLRLEAHSIGSVYIEDLRLKLAPELDLEVLRQREDALGELLSEIHRRTREETLESGALKEELLAGLSGIPSDLRRQVLSEFGEVLADAERLLVARLLEPEGNE